MDWVLDDAMVDSGPSRGEYSKVVSLSLVHGLGDTQFAVLYFGVVVPLGSHSRSVASWSSHAEPSWSTINEHLLTLAAYSLEVRPSHVLLDLPVASSRTVSNYGSRSICSCQPVVIRNALPLAFRPSWHHVEYICTIKKKESLWVTC